MAIPTISAVTLDIGPTSGWQYVKIEGTGFQEPLPPQILGPVPIPTPTIAITFGGSPVREIDIASDTVLYVLTPIGDPGLVDIELANIDPNGVVIPGEVVVASDAYTYKMPSLHDDNDFTRVCETVIKEFRRQVLINTVRGTHTDFSADPLSGRTLIAKLPGVAIFGPKLTANRIHTYRENEHSGGNPALTFDARRRVARVDLEYSVLGISNIYRETLNMMANFQLFFDRNTTIRLQRDETDLTKGFVDYELVLTEPARLDGSPNRSNVVLFRGGFLIRAFEIESYAGFERDGIIFEGGVIETCELEFEKI